VKRVTLSSYFNFTSGYREVLNVLLTDLPENGYDIVPRTYSVISPEFVKYFDNLKFVDPNMLDLSLLSLTNDLGSSNVFLQMDFSRPRILYTMWESTRINDLMIELMNKYKHICVPNHYNKNNFIRQGLTTNIDVIPLFCDTNFFTYKEHIPNKKFVFGISNEDPRKNLSKVTKCFLKVFKGYNDVELCVKTNESIQKHFDPKIKYIFQKLTKESLRDWYYNLDVYLSGATCEGWGMMQQESMCCGRPIIYTNYGGLAEFVNGENNFEVGYDEVYSENCWGDYGGRWSEFKEEEFMEMMKYCYDNRDVVISKGKKVSLDACVYNKESFIKNISKIIDLYIKHD
jgi:glycosyltransferase involved in cell wall biosynthesis